MTDRELRLVCVFLLLLISCSAKRNIENKIDFSFDKLQQSTLSETISNYSIIKLETKEVSKINIIKKVIIKNDKIYILNYQPSKQEILIFSINGKYIKKIPDRAKTDSLLNIMDFDINPLKNEITILDLKQRELVNFDEKSNYINSYKINCKAKEISYGIEEGKVFMVLYSNSSKNISDINYEIIILNENYKVSGKFFPYNNSIYPVQGNRKTLMKRGGYVMFLKRGTNNLFKIGLKKCRKSSEMIFPKPVLPLDKRFDAFFRGDIDLTEYVYNIDYYESNELVYITFSSLDGNYIGLYDKKADSSLLYNMLLDPSCKCGVKIDMVGTYMNKFIVQIPRVKIRDVMNILDHDRNRCNNKEMLKVIDNMKPGENPILLLLALKLN